jgi:hypothetical protein
MIEAPYHTQDDVERDDEKIMLSEDGSTKPHLVH